MDLKVGDWIETVWGKAYRITEIGSTYFMVEVFKDVLDGVDEGYIGGLHKTDLGVIKGKLSREKALSCELRGSNRLI